MLMGQGIDVGDDRDPRVGESGLGESRPQSIGSRPHQLGMKRSGHRQRNRSHRAGTVRRLDHLLQAGSMSRQGDIARTEQIGDLQDFVVQPSGIAKLAGPDPRPNPAPRSYLRPIHPPPLASPRRVLEPNAVRLQSSTHRQKPSRCTPPGSNPPRYRILPIRPVRVHAASPEPPCWSTTRPVDCVLWHARSPPGLQNRWLPNHNPASRWRPQIDTAPRVAHRTVACPYPPSGHPGAGKRNAVFAKVVAWKEVEDVEFAKRPPKISPFRVSTTTTSWGRAPASSFWNRGIGVRAGLSRCAGFKIATADRTASPPRSTRTDF